MKGKRRKNGRKKKEKKLATPILSHYKCKEANTRFFARSFRLVLPNKSFEQNACQGMVSEISVSRKMQPGKDYLFNWR